MATCVQGTWAFHELARIEALPKADLILEVHNVMNGYTYSWKSIQKVLQDRDVDIAFQLEWDDLCELKRTWDGLDSLTRDRKPEYIEACLSHDSKTIAWDPKFLRTLLLNLRLILIRAGLEDDKAITLVSENFDGPARTDFEGKGIYSMEWAGRNRVDEGTPLLVPDPPPSELRQSWAAWIKSKIFWIDSRVKERA